MPNRSPVLQVDTSGQPCCLAGGSLVPDGFDYRVAVLALKGLQVLLPNLTPADVTAGDGYVEQVFVVPGLKTTDTIAVNQPVMVAPPHCQMVAFRCPADDRLALTFHAVSGTHAPPQGVYRVLAVRS